MRRLAPDAVAEDSQRVGSTEPVARSACAQRPRPEGDGVPGRTRKWWTCSTAAGSVAVTVGTGPRRAEGAPRDHRSV